MKKYILAGAASLLLAACSSTKTEEYAANTPKIDIREYLLKGDTEAWGAVFGPSGMVDSRFHVVLKGNFSGNTGTLEESFTYDDGRKDTRIWTITFQDDNHFTATAPDVIGKAIGTQHGNAANMKYTLNAKRSNGETVALQLDDWLYQIDEKTIINRAKMKKFGLKVGELVVVFRK